jgi:outer membrane protein assembly factor BamD
VAVLLVSGCFFRSQAPVPETPEAAWTYAMRAFRSGQWGDAQEAFRRLTFDLPARDSLLPRARFYLAETQLAQGEVLTAARDFRRVADDFPADALAPFALLRSGDAYLRQWRRAELDPSNGETALAVYQELDGRYPDSQAARLGGLRIQEIRDRFALKEFQAGVFYLRRGAYDSAILYFRGLIARYPTASVVPQAFVSLVRAYSAIGYGEEREETCAHLRQHFGGRADVREACGDGAAGR